jgi:hypothetical protein
MASPVKWASKSVYTDLIDLLNKLVFEGIITGGTTITTALATFTTEAAKY